MSFEKEHSSRILLRRNRAQFLKIRACSR